MADGGYTVEFDISEKGQTYSKLVFNGEGTVTFKVDSGESGDFELTFEKLLNIDIFPGQETEENLFELADFVDISYDSKDEFLKPVTHEDVCRVFVSDEYESDVPVNYDGSVGVEVTLEGELLSVDFSYSLGNLNLPRVLLPFYIEECESGEVRGPFFATRLSGLNWKELKEYGEAGFDPSNEPDTIFGNKHNDHFASGGYDFGDKPQSITLEQFAKNADLIKEFDYEYIYDELWINFELLGGDKIPGEYDGNIDEYREVELTVKRVTPSEAGLSALGVQTDFESQLDSPNYVISVGNYAKENPFEGADYDSSKFLYQSIAVKEMSFVWDTQASTFNGNAGLPPGIYELTLTATNDDEYDSRTIFVDLEEEESDWPNSYQFSTSRFKQTVLGGISIDHTEVDNVDQFDFSISNENDAYAFSYVDSARVGLNEKFNFEFDGEPYNAVFTEFNADRFQGSEGLFDSLDCGGENKPCWTLTLANAQAGLSQGASGQTSPGTAGAAGSTSVGSPDLAGRVAMAPDNPLSLFKPIPLYFVAKMAAKVPGMNEVHSFGNDQPKIMICFDDLGECFKITKVSDAQPVTDENFNVERVTPAQGMQDQAHVLVFAKFVPTFEALATEEQKSALRAAAGVIFMTDTQGNLQSAINCLDARYASNPRPSFSTALQNCITREAPALLNKLAPFISMITELATDAAQGDETAINTLTGLANAFTAQLPAGMQASAQELVGRLTSDLSSSGSEERAGAVEQTFSDLQGVLQDGGAPEFSGIEQFVEAGAEVLTRSPISASEQDLRVESFGDSGFENSAPGVTFGALGGIAGVIVEQFESVFAEPTPQQYKEMCRNAYSLSTQRKVLVWAPEAPNSFFGDVGAGLGKVGNFLFGWMGIRPANRLDELDFDKMFGELSNSQGGDECFNKDAALIKGTDESDVRMIEAAFPYCTTGSLQSVINFNPPQATEGTDQNAASTAGAAASSLPEPVSPCSEFDSSSLIGLQGGGYIDCQDCQDYYVYVDGVQSSKAGNAFLVDGAAKAVSFTDYGNKWGVQYGSFTTGREYWVTIFDSNGEQCHQDKYVAYPRAYCKYYFLQNSNKLVVFRVGSGSIESSGHFSFRGYNGGAEVLSTFTSDVVWFGSHPVFVNAIKVRLNDLPFDSGGYIIDGVSGVAVRFGYTGTIQCSPTTEFSEWPGDPASAFDLVPSISHTSQPAPTYSTLSEAGETVATNRATQAVVETVVAPAVETATPAALPLRVEAPADPVPVASTPLVEEPSAPAQETPQEPIQSNPISGVDLTVIDLNYGCGLMNEAKSNCPNAPLTANKLVLYSQSFETQFEQCLQSGAPVSLFGNSICGARSNDCLNPTDRTAAVNLLNDWSSSNWWNEGNIQSVLSYCQTTASAAGYEYLARSSGSLSDKHHVSVLLSRKALAKVSHLLLTETSGYDASNSVSEADLPFLFAALSRVPETELASARERLKEPLCDLTRELSAEGEVLVDWGYQENAFDYAVKFLPWFFGLSEDRPDWKGAMGYGEALTGPNACFERSAVIGPDQKEYARITALREELGK